MGDLKKHLHPFPSSSAERRKNGVGIQDAIRSGKPFRRICWVDDDILVIYKAHDIVLVLESAPDTSVELDVQDILADDWYTGEPGVYRRSVARLVLRGW
jgi:hypothetical protein